MKIGIITFHFVSNHGGVLQCYALQNYLLKMGHDVKVINYRPSYHTVRYMPFKNPFLVARSNWKKNYKTSVIKRSYAALRGFGRGLILSVKRTDSLRYKKFNSFIEKYLNQTREYRSIAQLQHNPPLVDVLIAGSDQLWNPDLLENNFDSAYFLDFGKENVRRITYAVSLKEHFDEKQKNNLADLCKKLDAISVRENNEELREIVNLPIYVNIDPTLLLTKEDYHILESPIQVNYPYVFVYGFENLPEIEEAVRNISEQRNLKIINGAPHRIRLSSDCEKVYNYSPSDFLSYVKNADFVITNSFHGLAFSIIYEKQFIVIKHSTRGKRMLDLLDCLDLKGTLWSKGACTNVQVVDYEKVRSKLEKLRESAFQYFETNLK